MDDAPTLDVLLPTGQEPIAPDDAETRLTALFPEPTLPWVRANMISTLDGAATGADARSGSINGAADGRVFQALRARADVILVGAGTVRAEGYRAPRTPDPLLAGRRLRGQTDHPALAIITASGELPVAVLTDSPAPWVVSTPDAAHLDRLQTHLPAHKLLLHDGAVHLPAAVAALAAAGHGRILSEGGPHLLAELLAAGIVDELCLTWSPLVVGGPAMRVVAGAGWFMPPVSARLSHLLHADGTLLGRWLLGEPPRAR